MLVSVTRLHVRSARFLPIFFVWTYRSTLQVRHAAGCLRGMTGSESLTGYWTVTAWESDAAMHRFRNGPPHLQAMRRLIHWCDEASFAHWEQSDSRLPDGAEAHRRLSVDGRTSKVAYPSASHAAGHCTGSAMPKFGYRFGQR